MRTKTWAAALAAAMILAACGGGGGNAGTSPFGSGSGSGTGTGGTGTGGTTTPVTAPSLTLKLQDTAGAALTTQSLTGTQNAVAVVQVLDAAGAPVPNTLVTVSSAGLTLTPTSGQTITDSTGTARVQIRPTDPFGSGATTLSAASSVAGTAVQSSLAIGLGAATAALSPMTVSASVVPAYQTVQVSVPATLTGGGVAAQYPVDFSSTCGLFDPTTAITDANGVARSAYRNQSGTTACSGTQTLTAKAGTSTVATTVTAQAPVAANIVFVSAAPSRIYLSGSPGVSQSLVTFKLVDSNGNAVQGQNINLALTLKPNGAYLGANAGTTSLQQPTNSDGTVSVAVNAGAQPGPVQVQATLQGNTTIRNVSNSLAIASGLPVQRAFSMSVSKFNIEALDYDGITTDITLRIADRLGNPVPDGTTVNFITEGGQVVGSCNTTGAAANSTSACSVQLSSQSPRPTNGRLTVLAWAQGEENFTDSGTPTNNVYDAGESFEDLGQPFLDKNENGLYDVGSDVTVGTASGAAACPAGSLLSVPGTCDGAWGSSLVRQSVVIVFSGSDAVLTKLGSTIANGQCVISFNLADRNGNPLPAGSALALVNAKGGGSGTTPDAVFFGFGLDGNAIPNTSKVGGSQHSVIFSSCSDLATLTFGVSVTTAHATKTFLLP